jgi:hypothetical protein
MGCSDAETNKGLYNNPKKKIKAEKGFWKELYWDA